MEGKMNETATQQMIRKLAAMDHFVRSLDNLCHLAVIAGVDPAEMARWTDMMTKDLNWRAAMGEGRS